MEFRRRSSDALVDFGVKLTTPFEINRSSKPPEPTSSQSFTPTATVSHIIFADFIIWRLISVGSRGPSWQNAHGLKSEAEAKERSLPKSMGQSSLQKKMQSAAPTMDCFTKPAPPKPMQQTSRQRISTGK